MEKIKKYLIAVPFLLITVGLFAYGITIILNAMKEEQIMTYTDISPEEAKKRIDSGEEIILLDVRTEAEFREERIPGSILIPIEPEDEVTETVEQVIPDKNAVVFIYCRTGRRSVDAAEVLVAKGYRKVYNLGGIVLWPYEKEKG